MKVSIITVCYNSGDTIESAIKSVLSQSYPDIEYIIVDGKSTDTTLEVINKYKSKITKFISEKDRGLYDAINKGIGLASGDIVGLLHSDDLFADDRVISDVVQLFEKEQADAVYADLEYVDKEDTSKVTRRWKSGKYEKGMFKKGWMPPHPTFFVKRDLYDQYGVFNTDFKFAADYELMLRFIHKFHIELAYLPRVTVKMRTGGKSNVSLKNRIKANLEDRKAWKVNGLSPGPFTLIQKPLHKINQFIKKASG